MIKRIVVGLLLVGILGGLAYYSGSLYSNKSLAENSMHLKEPMGHFVQTEFQKYESQKMLEARQRERLEEDKQEASTEAEAILASEEEESYYLMEVDGYVRIYLGDRITLYEDTEITLEELPEDMQQEIYQGKRLRGKGELYDFLENYSS